MSTPEPLPALEDADAWIGRVLDGRWKITGLIGSGGMGSVYRVQHLTIGKPMAVKVLHPRLGLKGDFAARFEREAQVGGKIGHPNCVAVSDFGTLEDGSFYLVMELLQGEPLGEVLDREARLPWRRALHIARHVLRGLGHAHDHGVVHRDIKPDNIFLARTDDDPDFAKILDFGIAKLVGEGGTTITQAGITVGTPAYLSPEQAFGGELDGRSDLYSLSVVLYQMLAGKTPFGDRDLVAMLTAHAVADVPPIGHADVPPAVEALVRHGLGKQPGDRFQSAAEYVAGIDEILAGVTGPVSGQYAISGSYAIGTPPPGAMTPPPMGAVSPMATSTHPVVLPPGRVRRLVLTIGGAILAVGLVAALASQGGDGGGAARPKPAPVKAKPEPAPPKPAPPTPPPAAIELPAHTLEQLTASKEDRFKAALHDLEKGKTCEDRKAAVATLRELGDKRAIPALKKARYRMRGGVLGIGDSNTNKCLKAAAEEAMKHLSAQGDGGQVK